MQALTNVVLGLLSPALALRQRHPALNAIVEAYAYRSYAAYFRAVSDGQEPDPPTSDDPATEDLLTTLWATIVFREEQQFDEALLGTELAYYLPPETDDAEDGRQLDDLDELYALAFDRMIEIASAPEGTEGFFERFGRPTPPPTIVPVTEITAPSPSPQADELADFRKAVSEAIGTVTNEPVGAEEEPVLAEEAPQPEPAPPTERETLRADSPEDAPTTPDPEDEALAPATAPPDEPEPEPEPEADAPPARVLVLNVSLEDAHVPIWRRVAVLDTTPLADLHKIIQSAVGWENSHMHQFTDRVDTYGPPSAYLAGEHIDYTKLRVADLLGEVGSVLFYEYDFGDNWRHRIEVERIQDNVPGQPYPLCTGGRGACPPEDVGGVWGYAHFREVLADPEHAEYEDMQEWIGGDFDPAFDVLSTNLRLHSKNYGVFESSNPFLRRPQ